MKQDRAVALDIELPAATHRLKQQLIELIVAARKKHRYPMPGGVYPEDAAADAARAHADKYAFSHVVLGPPPSFFFIGGGYCEYRWGR